MAFCLLAVAGCLLPPPLPPVPPIYKAYEGPVLPDEKVSRIYLLQEDLERNNLLLYSFNDKNFRSFYHEHNLSRLKSVHALPGTHEMKFGTSSGLKATLQLTTKAGCKYKVSAGFFRAPEDSNIYAYMGINIDEVLPDGSINHFIYRTPQGCNPARGPCPLIMSRE